MTRIASGIFNVESRCALEIWLRVIQGQ